MDTCFDALFTYTHFERHTGCIVLPCSGGFKEAPLVHFFNIVIKTLTDNKSNLYDFIVRLFRVRCPLGVFDYGKFENHYFRDDTMNFVCKILPAPPPSPKSPNLSEEPASKCVSRNL